MEYCPSRDACCSTAYTDERAVFDGAAVPGVLGTELEGPTSHDVASTMAVTDAKRLPFMRVLTLCGRRGYAGSVLPRPTGLGSSATRESSSATFPMWRPVELRWPEVSVTRTSRL